MLKIFVAKESNALTRQFSGKIWPERVSEINQPAKCMIKVYSRQSIKYLPAGSTQRNHGLKVNFNSVSEQALACYPETVEICFVSDLISRYVQKPTAL